MGEVCRYKVYMAILLSIIQTRINFGNLHMNSVIVIFFFFLNLFNSDKHMFQLAESLPA